MAKRVFAFALLLSSLASAGTGLNYRIHHEYQSLRALGMGDAFVAVANDYSGLFYNPAGLVRRDEGQINMYIDGAFSTDFIKFAQSIGDAASTTTNTEEAIMNVLQDAYGSNYSARLSLPNGVWVRPGWGFAIIPVDLTLNLGLHQSLGPVLNTTVISDTIMAYGFAKDYYWIDQGRTSVGVTFKAINRGYFNQLVAAVDIAADPNVIKPESFSEGMTVDADIGALFTPEIPTEGLFSLFRLARPTFGAVVRNVFDYGFKTDLNLYNKTANVTDPEKLYRRIDLGSRWEYPEFLIFGGRGVMDIRDILHPQFSLKKGLHIGFEYDWTMFSWWRGQYRFGYSQGYLTAGASALFSFFNLDLVTYAEDVGTRNNPRESRKFELRMNIDI
ncbi:MAG: hypothetical protein RJB66_2218 [Pseudomonadota bacterium]